MKNFASLGLSKNILDVIAEMGFEQPSEIQIKAIPHLLESSRDFVGLAQTGTGKTAAFGLPLLERIDPSNKSIQGLVLVPTRELGIQVAGQLEQFSKYLEKINVTAVYGGAPIEKQIRALKQPQQVVIATPGRLIDLMRRKVVSLDDLNYLVLDEADEMLTMGFKEELDTILSQAPFERLTWLFSATMSSEVHAIAKKYMFDPFEVRIDPKQQTNKNIAHQYVTVRRNNKTEALLRFLDADPDIRGIVFCRTRRDTQELAEFLGKLKYRVDALHGDLSQAQRDRVMRRFRQNELQVLIATDIAARGIDVNDLTHVFHYSLPDESAYYTHRSGRTGRAGKTGISIAVVDERDFSKIKWIEKELKLSFEKIDIPSIDQIRVQLIEKWCKRILDQNSKRQENEDSVKQALIRFESLSKEELISKLIANELEKLSTQSDEDLNITHDGKGDPNQRRRGRGRNRRSRSSRRRDKGYRSGRSKSHRKGGGRTRK